MFIIFDDRIVNILQDKFKLGVESIVYGTPESAKTFWIHKNEGVFRLPFLSFYRTIMFHDLVKGEYLVPLKVVKSDGSFEVYEFDYVKCMMEYVLDFYSTTVIQQNDFIKRYLFWANGAPVIKFKDYSGMEWVSGVWCESPVDNSDLESEFENGRILRTTVNIKVEAIVLNDDLVGNNVVLITDILLKISNYFNYIEGKELLILNI